MEPITTGAALYEAIKARGLHLRHGYGRDNVLLAELCAALGCKRGLAKHLAETGIDSETFLRAFLDVAAPFAEMFQEIWAYLATHLAPGAKETLRVRFGFDTDGIELDLEQFRLWAETARALFRARSVTLWPQSALLALHQMFTTRAPRSARRWPAYHPFDAYSLPAFSGGDEPLDRVMARIHDVFGAIVVQAGDLDDATRRRIGGGKPGLDPLDAAIGHASFALTDLIPAWGHYFETYGQLSQAERAAALDVFETQIEPLIKNNEREDWGPEIAPLDLLEMPFWKHRWHTYEIWATVESLRALADYHPRLEVVDGRTGFDSTNPMMVAALDVVDRPDAGVWVQLQTDFRRGKRRAIRPDLSICDDGEGVAESRAVVVEFKQRLGDRDGHFDEVGTSYSLGAPAAGGVLLVNYDTPGLTPIVPANVRYHEGLRPGQPAVRAAVASDLLWAMDAAGLRPHARLTVALLDVSGSMRPVYEQHDVEQLRAQLSRIPWLVVKAFADGLVDDDEAGLFRARGGTDLEAALQALFARIGVPDTLLVVSDGQYGREVPSLHRVPRHHRVDAHDLGAGLAWILAGHTRAR